MKMCRWACGLTLRDHVSNDNTRETLKLENIREVQESEKGGLNTCRDEAKNTSEEILWRWYHDQGEEDEDRSREGWIVSTET